MQGSGGRVLCEAAAVGGGEGEEVIQEEEISHKNWYIKGAVSLDVDGLLFLSWRGTMLSTSCQNSL